MPRIFGQQINVAPRENLIKEIVKKTKEAVNEVEKKLVEARALANDLENHLNLLTEEEKEEQLNKWILIEETIKNNNKLTDGQKQGEIERLNSLMERFKQYERSIEQMEGRMKAEDASKVRYILKGAQGVNKEHEDLREFLQLLEQHRLHPGDMKVDGLIAKMDEIIRIQGRIDQYDAYITRWQRRSAEINKQRNQYTNMRNKLFSDLKIE